MRFNELFLNKRSIVCQLTKVIQLWTVYISKTRSFSLSYSFELWFRVIWNWRSKLLCRSASTHFTLKPPTPYTLVLQQVFFFFLHFSVPFLDESDPIIRLRQALSGVVSTHVLLSSSDTLFLHAGSALLPSAASLYDRGRDSRKYSVVAKWLKLCMCSYGLHFLF